MVLTASEARKQARESLRGKWSIIILTFLLYMVYNTLVACLSIIPFLGTILFIAGIVFDVPFTYGLVMSTLKLKRGENINCYDFFVNGWQNFSRAWCLTGRLILKMIVPIILVIVGIILTVISIVTAFAGGILYSSSDVMAGGGILSVIASLVILAGYILAIVYGFKYALSMFIAVDNPNMRPVDCVNKSAELMNGNKGRLFCLFISFIGWYLLAGLLCIIPFVNVIIPFIMGIVLSPYVQMAFIVFYENRMGIDSSTTVAEGFVNTSNEIVEQSGSTDVKAEIVDIPNTEDK